MALESRSPVEWVIQVIACGKAQPTECRAGQRRSLRRGDRMDAAWLQGLWGFLGMSRERFHQSYTQDDAASGHSGPVLSYLGGLSGSDEEALAVGSSRKSRDFEPGNKGASNRR